MISDDINRLRNLAETELLVPAPLHEYQWEGVSFLFRSHAALLADEMGLGKTVQTAVALALLMNGRSDVNRVLIVAPASLTMNWVSELSIWAPSLAVRLIHGSASNREAFYLLPIPVLVGSYEQIRQDGLELIPLNTFDLIILDEAQRIKNKNSTTALACRILQGKRAWALSATPLENKDDDVKSILGFLDPSICEDLSDTHLIEKLRSMMLRRRKSDVRTELPPVIYQDLVLALSKPQRKVYDELWLNRIAAISTGNTETDSSVALLGLITKLKIVCNLDEEANVSSKLDALKEVIESAGESARILVFSQFVKTIKWISERIELPHGLLIGSMSLEDRQKNVDEFRNNKSPRLLLISLRAGGVGLNLGEATHVVVFDRWWNPAVEAQAIYRAHRFDRAGPLHVVRFLIADSIEEQIADILDQKSALFDCVIESVETSSYSFTKKELMQILKISDRDLS
ncbi:MAG: DEAD/DEAH box helicase [Gammaproteobacteria bacterium]|nr:DEAD/DEAH box helicase [Gammaproteobacteria bacterium]